MTFRLRVAAKFFHDTKYPMRRRQRFFLFVVPSFVSPFFLAFYLASAQAQHSIWILNIPFRKSKRRRTTKKKAKIPDIQTNLFICSQKLCSVCSVLVLKAQHNTVYNDTDDKHHDSSIFINGRRSSSLPPCKLTTRSWVSVANFSCVHRSKSWRQWILMTHRHIMRCFVHALEPLLNFCTLRLVAS